MDKNGVSDCANRGVTSTAGHAATKKETPLKFAPAGHHRCAKSLNAIVNSATMTAIRRTTWPVYAVRTQFAS